MILTILSRTLRGLGRLVDSWGLTMAAMVLVMLVTGDAGCRGQVLLLAPALGSLLGSLLEAAAWGLGRLRGGSEPLHRSVGLTVAATLLVALLGAASFFFHRLPSTAITALLWVTITVSLVGYTAASAWRVGEALVAVGRHLRGVLDGPPPVL